MKKLILILFCVFSSFNVISQSNLKAEMRKQNPVKEKSTINDYERIIIHKKYLAKAIADKNKTHQFYGNLFLFVDYYFTHDYVQMNKSLLEAESIAKKTKNESWNGIINYRKAMVFDIKQDKKAALKHYFMAFENCKIAKDSMCMGECLEQISAKYKELENLDKAHFYYKQALPFLSKFGDSYQMALTYNNYSNLLTQEEKFEESKIYIDSAISMAYRNNDLYKVTLYKFNKASLYSSTKEYTKALNLFKEGEKINKENNWNDLLMYNYMGQSELYEELGNYKLFSNYLNKYYQLKDSIKGVEVQVKMNESELKYKTKEQELKLKTTQLELAKNVKKNERYLWFSIIILALLIILILIWRIKNKENKIEYENNKKKLLELTNQIIEKNEKIIKQQEIINLKSSNNVENLDSNLKNQKILTESDWSSFKAHFEQAYPNYIHKIRKKFPKITDAEERLFLCIKLNLRTKETASMLAISDDSVKKNKSRLKKRLALQAEENLIEFVKAF